tara:strand:- start:6759 stop:6887 length:129 start_codon:yes stop_codon:yes gene_type:complete
MINGLPLPAAAVDICGTFFVDMAHNLFVDLAQTRSSELYPEL